MCACVCVVALGRAGGVEGGGGGGGGWFRAALRQDHTTSEPNKSKAHTAFRNQPVSTATTVNKTKQHTD